MAYEPENIPDNPGHEITINRHIDRMGQAADLDRYSFGILHFKGLLSPWEETTIDEKIKEEIHKLEQLQREDIEGRLLIMTTINELLIKKKIKIFGKPTKDTDGIIDHGQLEDDLYKKIQDELEEQEEDN